jgi:hypothetical protein
MVFDRPHDLHHMSNDLVLFLFTVSISNFRSFTSYTVEELGAAQTLFVPLEQFEGRISLHRNIPNVLLIVQSEDAGRNPARVCARRKYYKNFL